ncbi:hypothetical protein VTN00DRAFT_6031 [Thermoascus crustaceus]|uniref:uncharacterized protein n=1 Tax=Thermoascus crustaceus TaxID=5088 RepID=UPI003743C22F
MKSASSKSPNCHGSVYKEVRFSPSATPVRRAQSVATSNPLLDPIYAAGIGARASSVDVCTEFSTYAEQSRALLESQRINFERERAMFAEERKLWDRERAVLKSRIAELESALNGRSQKLGTSAAGPFRSDFSFQQNSPGAQSQQSGSDNGHHVWEGSSPHSKPTRVFTDENRKPDSDLPPIREHGLGPPPSLDTALSPRSKAVDHSATASVPVPIEKLDSNLDGITLKSTALPPDLVAKVMTPPSPSPLDGSPSQNPDPKALKEGPERRNSLKLKLSDLGPPDKNLTRDAGHTPMVIVDTETELNQQSSSEVTSYAGNPAEPVSTLRLPTEQSDSYFPDLDEDPALAGPLSLQNEEEKDRDFLNELDQKLLDEARKVLSNSSDPSAQNLDDDDDERSGEGEQEPELKLKHTNNFGTAFGIVG